MNVSREGELYYREVMPVLKCQFCNNEFEWGVDRCPHCKRPYKMVIDFDDQTDDEKHEPGKESIYCKNCGSRFDQFTGSCSSCKNGQRITVDLEEESALPHSKSGNFLKYISLLLLLAFFLVGSVGLYQFLSAMARYSSISMEAISDPIFRPTDLSKLIEDPLTGMEMESGTIMVVIQEDITRDQVSEAVAVINGQVVGGLEEIKVFEIAIPEDDPATLHAAINSLKVNQIFKTVLPNYVPDIDQGTTIPDVPQWTSLLSFKKRWGQEEINMPQAWSISTGEIDNRTARLISNKINVAIIDTGFDLTHPDLVNSVLITIQQVPWYKVGKIDHGTSVASVAGASAYNKQGMAGIIWQPVLYCYQVDSFKDIKTALYDAYNKGIRVANISYGIDWKAMEKKKFSETEIAYAVELIRAGLEGCIEYVGKDNALNNSGMVIVSSAGNSPNRSADMNYPQGFAAEYDHVISVGSIARDSSASKFSSSGKSVSVAAPGENIWAARKVYPLIPNYRYAKGTSFASPMVAGVAGLILAVNPDLSPGEVKKIIMDTAAPGYFDRLLGTGVLDAAAALLAAQATLGEKLVIAPNLISPADGSVVGESLINFSWETVDGADGYRLEVIQVGESGLFFESNLGDITSFTVKDFPGDGSEYQYRVAAGNLAGWGPYSSSFSFKNGETPTPTPTEPEVIEHADPKGKGNTAGNIANVGLAAIQGEWIYYINDKDGYSIYKIRTDGSGRTKINDDNSRYINVVGSWIYYTNYEGLGFQKSGSDYIMPVTGIPDQGGTYNIYRIRTDGSGRERLNNDNSRFLNVLDGWIYYNNQSDNGSLYRIRIDGSDRAKLNSGESLYINPVDSWIYYMKWGTECDIYRIRLDGSNENLVLAQNTTMPGGVRLNIVPWFLNVDKGWLFFSEMSAGRWIHKVNADDFQLGDRFDDSRDSYYLNLHENWIYYINDEDGGKIYRIRTDGSGKVKVNNEKSWLVNVAGDWIYYSNRDENDRFYRIRTDGSGKEPVY